MTMRLRSAWIIAVLLSGLAVAASVGARGEAGPAPDWSGNWQTFWRSGEAYLVLDQQGTDVTGSYEPGGGEISGRMDGTILRGQWREDGASGGFIFALSDDGRTFTGRYEDGEYWNGRRIFASTGGTGYSSSFSPRETLRTALAAANVLADENNLNARRFLDPLLVYEGEEEGARDLRARRAALWQILNMSTFRISDAPQVVEGREARFEIGPLGSQESYPLRFVLDDAQRWQIVVETGAELQAAVDRMLADLGHDTMADFAAARRNTPRQALRTFVLGTGQWDAGGAEAALSTLDLSFLPAHLREIEGEILADYLKQVLNRAGFVIWQEIPNDPGRTMPYVFYEHPVGSIVLERSVDDEGEPGPWLFSADTLRAIPRIYDAVQQMPIAEGIVAGEPFTGFFRLRQAIRAISPDLLRRDLLLENWQWLALMLGAALSGGLGWGAGAAVTLLPGGAGAAGDRIAHRLAWPVRITIVAGGLLIVVAKLGFAQNGMHLVVVVLSLFTTAGATLALFRLVDVFGHVFRHQAAARAAAVDEIASSLATAVVKLLIVVLGVIAAAELVGLPYEGVITGLGVGGIALAFAARDTVSNMIGGVILMADRPFKRGDLIETGGIWAMIDDVGLRSTRLRTLDDAVLIKPNAQLSDEAIINWGRRRRRKVLLQIGLTYETPRHLLDQFVEGLRKAYLDHDNSDTSEIYVGLKGFGNSSLDIELWGYMNVWGYDDYVRAQHDLIGQIVDLARAIGVSFAFPTRTLHVADGAGFPVRGDAAPAVPDARADA